MMTDKIVFIPLDGRPCNYYYPKKLFTDVSKDYTLKILPHDLFKINKERRDISKIINFIINECLDAYGLVISLDTLMYGGIVPSRLHFEDEKTLKERLNVLKQIKRNNPSIKIMAFNLVMRCPQGNYAVEEPDYFDICGNDIFRSGYYKHKEELGIITNEEKENYNNLHIKEEYLTDFLNRRKINLAMNFEAVKLVQEKIIDFLIVPQDDSAEYGYTVRDQGKVRKLVKESHVQTRVYLYPGADEVGLILLTRMINTFTKQKFKFYIKYPSMDSKKVIPCLEDRPIETSIKYQILASGGLVTPDISEADMILCAFIGPKRMIPGPDFSRDDSLDILPNYLEMIEFIDYYKDKKPVGIADMTFLNAGDKELFNLLNEKDLLLQVIGYSGWNTAANTLGTVISQMTAYHLFRRYDNNIEFLFHRYLEDIGYQAIIRSYLKNEVISKYGLNYFNLYDKKNIIIEVLKEKYQEFISTYLSKYQNMFTITKYDFPWNRLFEVEIEVKLNEE